jgi:hypothetical protein
VSDEAAVDTVVDITGSVVRTACKEVALTVVASTVKNVMKLLQITFMRHLNE